MERRLLICSDKGDFGDLLRYKLSKFGFSLTTICRGDLEKTEAAIKSCHYDIVFIFVPDDMADCCLTIERIVREHTDIKVYTAVYRDNQELIRQLTKAGADRCFVMPLSLADVCRAVFEDHTPFEEELILDIIDDYLFSKKFPRHMEGYGFMCIALEKCIEEPASLRDPENRIYAYVARLALTDPEYVRRAIADLCSNAYEKGTRFIGQSGNSELTPELVLTAAADEFVERYLSDKV